MTALPDFEVSVSLHVGSGARPRRPHAGPGGSAACRGVTEIPFDRLLIAQALQASLTLVSCDAAFAAYTVDLLNT